MKRRQSQTTFLLWMPVVAALGACTAGCHCCDSGGEVVGWTGSSMCFGYYPTCWRPWPEECANCPPPHATMGTAYEMIKPPPANLEPPSLPPDAGPQTPTAEGTLDLAPPAPLLPPADQQGSSRRHWIEGRFTSQPAY